MFFSPLTSPGTGYEATVYTFARQALEAGTIVTKTARRRRNEKGVSVKVVSGQLQRLTDRIISGPGRGGRREVKPGGYPDTHLQMSHTTTVPPSSIHHPGRARWIVREHWTEMIPLNSRHSSRFVTTNSTHGNHGRGWVRRRSKAPPQSLPTHSSNP